MQNEEVKIIKEEKRKLEQEIAKLKQEKEKLIEIIRRQSDIIGAQKEHMNLQYLSLCERFNTLRWKHSSLFFFISEYSLVQSSRLNHRFSFLNSQCHSVISSLVGSGLWPEPTDRKLEFSF